MEIRVVVVGSWNKYTTGLYCSTHGSGTSESPTLDESVCTRSKLSISCRVSVGTDLRQSIKVKSTVQSGTSFGTQHVVARVLSLVNLYICSSVC